jgi:hypothetical protein
LKVIICFHCFRHLKCIWRKWRKAKDYSWHVDHLLRELGCGSFADLVQPQGPGRHGQAAISGTGHSVAAAEAGAKRATGLLPGDAAENQASL